MNPCSLKPHRRTTTISVDFIPFLNMMASVHGSPSASHHISNAPVIVSHLNDCDSFPAVSPFPVWAASKANASLIWPSAQSPSVLLSVLRMQSKSLPWHERPSLCGPSHLCPRTYLELLFLPPSALNLELFAVL